MSRNAATATHRIGALGVCLSLLVPAAAQAADVLVVPGPVWDLDGQAAADIVEESAWIVDDLPEHSATRHYQLNDGLASELANCQGDPVCVTNTVQMSGLDLALIVSVEAVDDGVLVAYQSYEIRTGASVGEQTVAMSVANDFGVLPEGVELALAGWEPEPIAVSAAPQTMPVDTSGAFATESVALRPSSRPRPLQELGPLGRAGTLTAVSGSALAVGGVLMGFAADNTQQTIQRSVHLEEDLSALQSQGQTQNMLSNVMLGVGGAAVISGVVMYLMDKKDEGERADRFDLGVDPVGRAVQVRARF